MERQLWEILYRLICSLPITRPTGAVYDDNWLVLVFAWSALNDRPRNWACNPRNWPRGLLLGRTLPSPSTLSRRLRQVAGELPETARRWLLEKLPSSSLRWIDSRPLRVPGRSTDKDAPKGFVAEGFSHGYRMHALVDPAHMTVTRWELAGMNRNDSIIAPTLLATVPSGTTIVGDGQYDVDHLYQLASNQGCRWLARPRKNGQAKDGSRRSSEQRRDSLAWAATREGRRLLKTPA